MNALEPFPCSSTEGRGNDVSNHENSGETFPSAHSLSSVDFPPSRVIAGPENGRTSHKWKTEYPLESNCKCTNSPHADTARRPAGYPHGIREAFREMCKLPSVLGACVPLSRWQCLSVFSIYALLTGPAYLNWAPLRQLLFDCAVYKWICREDITDPTSAYFIESGSGTCAQQRVRVANLFTLCTVADYGMSFFGGLVMDFYGPKAASIAGTLCMLLGWLLLGLSSSKFQAFEAGAVVYGLGIDMAFYGTLTVGALFPRKENTVRALLVAMRCASYLIPLILQRLAAAFNVPYNVIMLGFGGLAYIPALLLAAIFIPSTCREYLRKHELVLPFTERRKDASHPENRVECSNHESLSYMGDRLKEVTREEGEGHDCLKPHEQSRKPHALNVVDTSRGQTVDVITSRGCNVVCIETSSSLHTYSANSPARLGNSALRTLEAAQTSSELSCGSDVASSGEVRDYISAEHGTLETGDVEVSDDKREQPASVNKCREQGGFEKKVFGNVLPTQKRGNLERYHHCIPRLKKFTCILLERSTVVRNTVDFTRVYLCSGLYFPVVPYFVITLVRAVYFNTASHDLVPHALPFLHFIIGFVFVFPPLFGFLADRFGVILCMVLTNSFGFLVIIGSLLVVEAGVIFVEYVVSVLFMLTLSMMTNQIFFYVGDTFPQQHLGKLIGFACTVGGLLSLLASPMFRYSVEVSKNNGSAAGFRHVLLLLTVFSIVTSLLLFIIYKKKRRSKVRPPDERITQN